MGKHIFYLGAIGSGQSVKIINNLVFNTIFFGTVEALKLAKAMGIDRARIIEVMKVSSSSSFALENLDQVIERRRASAPEEIRQICYKDIGLGLDLANDFNTDLLLAKCCQGSDITSNVEVLLN